LQEKKTVNNRPIFRNEQIYNALPGAVFRPQKKPDRRTRIWERLFGSLYMFFWL